MKQKILSLTWTILLMTIGNMLRGKRRMLNRARDTNAFCASRTLCSSTNTYTANVERATLRKTANFRNSKQHEKAKWKNCTLKATYQKWCADPGESGHGAQVSGLLQHIQFTLSDGRYFIFEGQFPCVEFKNFNAIQHLIHKLDPVVFAFHLGNLWAHVSHLKRSTTVQINKQLYNDSEILMTYKKWDSNLVCFRFHGNNCI